jgi:hypothetical protein
MNVFKLIEDNNIELHGDIEYFAELVRWKVLEECAKQIEARMTGASELMDVVRKMEAASIRGMIGQ